MKAMELKSHWRSAAAVVGASTLLFTVGCGTARDAAPTATAQTAANQAGAPVVVSCEPHQRTLVRQAVVNGATVSQVECVAAGQPSAYAAATLAQPVATSGFNSYAPAPAAPVRVVTQPVVYDTVPDTRIIRSAPRTAARPVRTSQRVYRTSQPVYDEVPVRRTRSVKKSAIIIGSSAGVGAGVGAAVGGKKGALIGAAIGGGSAAVWDQVTRRKEN